jgi:hypothetical protein
LHLDGSMTCPETRIYGIEFVLSFQGNRPHRRRHRAPVPPVGREREIPRVAVYRVRHRLRPLRRRQRHVGSNGGESSTQLPRSRPRTFRA